MTAPVLVLWTSGSLYRDPARHGRNVAHPCDVRAKADFRISRDGVRDIRDRAPWLLRVGPSYVYQRNGPADRYDVLAGHPHYRSSIRDQDLQLAWNAVGRANSLHYRDAVLDRLRIAVRLRRRYRNVPRPDFARSSTARYVLRSRPLSHDYGSGGDLRYVRRNLLLVPEDVRQDDGRRDRQGAFLAYIHRRKRDLHSDAHHGNRRSASKIRVPLE